MRLGRVLLIVQLVLIPGYAQKAALRRAAPVTMPAVADCNSPAHWRDGQIHVFNSAGDPKVSAGIDQFHLGSAGGIQVDSDADYPMWFESTWLDSNGDLYAWYHNEPAGLCQGKLTVPRIGAVVSYDGGATFRDLGIVLESGDSPDCSAANGFFAGGHGDFSVILDQAGKHFYFLFGNYGGSLASQGVATARMAFEDRGNPAGRVWKYFNGDWNEPGLGGRVTPVFPAKVAWQDSKTDSFWGPSVHWNTFLQSYVVLMNRSCCRPNWPQEGVYATFNKDLADPAGWSTPDRIMAKPPDYYPQVLGLEEGGTDTTAGEVARFYIHGSSGWEIVFYWPEATGESDGAKDPASASRPEPVASGAASAAAPRPAHR